MGKDPAFLFYPGDWDGGTKLLTRHEKGAYIDLLMCQFHCGHMTSHEVGHVLGQNDFDAIWESKLKTKFKQDSDGKFFNQRLEEEQVKRKNWCSSRRNNVNGKNQYGGHMTKHMLPHMENENIDENKVKNTTNNSKKEDLFLSIWEKYPNKQGKKAAQRHFLASVKSEEDWKNINKAIRNYIEYTNGIDPKYIKNGSTWFNDWECWVNRDVKEKVELL